MFSAASRSIILICSKGRLFYPITDKHFGRRSMSCSFCIWSSNVVLDLCLSCEPASLFPHYYPDASCLARDWDLLGPEGRRGTRNPHVPLFQIIFGRANLHKSGMSRDNPRHGVQKELTPTEFEQMRAKWLPEILEQNPQLLLLRERTLPWTGGFSFSNLVNTAMTATLAPVNRKILLELIIQHLFAIGMNQTAETIIEETGHTFQEKKQPWDKTDLLLLVSLGVLPREDPWNIPDDPAVTYVEEPLEEDFFASPYREDPRGIAQSILNPDSDVLWIDPESPKTYQNMRASSLNRLVLSLTNFGVGNFIRDEDLSAFFLSLNTVTSSLHFFEHLKTAFEMDIDPQAKVVLGEEGISKIRVGIVNVLKKWVSCRGLFIGRRALKAIKRFCEQYEADDSYKALLSGISESMETLTYGSQEVKPNQPKELPVIRDVQILFRPGLTLIDPEPQETARQITLVSHASFKAIHTREFMVALVAKKCSVQAPTLGEFLEFQNKIGQLALETILFSSDKTAAFARVLDIAQHLEQIANFQSLSVILSQLMRDEVLSIVQATPKQIEVLKHLSVKCGDAPGSFDAYASFLCVLFREWKPAIPNIRAEVRNSQIRPSSDFINGLINWGKRREITARAGIFYRLQNKAFSFHPVPQIQKVIQKGPLRPVSQIEEVVSDQWRAVNEFI